VITARFRGPLGIILGQRLFFAMAVTLFGFSGGKPPGAIKAVL